MFCICNIVPKRYYTKKTLIKANNFNQAIKIVSKQNTLNMFFTKAIRIYKPTSSNSLRIDRNFSQRLYNLTKLPFNICTQWLSEIQFNLVNTFSFEKLYFFFKKIFWIVPVPKHKQVLFFLRSLLKYIFKKNSLLIGLNVNFRGKLGATGNKRKSRFAIINGVSGLSTFTTRNVDDFRLIRTATGVIGVTTILTYIR